MPLTIYTVKEACNELAGRGLEITDKGLRKAMVRGALGYKKIGTVYVITQDELEEYIKIRKAKRVREDGQNS